MNTYLSGIKDIVTRSQIFTNKNVVISVIVNPVAGGFTMKSRMKENKERFAKVHQRALTLPQCVASASIQSFITEHKDHAYEYTKKCLKVAEVDTYADSVHLIITAGGDGTCSDVQRSFLEYSLDDKNNIPEGKICLLRLPFGTGNDGTDGRFLDDALSVLLNATSFAKMSAVSVYTPQNKEKPFYAFNITSIGLDAFVTDMTNKIKKYIPGDFYKIWVDIACLFYTRLFPVKKMHVSSLSVDTQKTVFSHSGKFIMYVFGASGNRTYGAGQKVLSDKNNICAVSDMSLFRKLSLKKEFLNGLHKYSKECLLYSAEKIVIEYTGKILLQLDGEGRLLSKADFPLVMQLTIPVIPVLH